MADIPPAGGSADVSSMLDAWLDDQSAAGGDWSPVETDVAPMPLDPHAGPEPAPPPLDSPAGPEPAPPPLDSPAGPEPAPTPAASLLDAVSALDARPTASAEPAAAPPGSAADRAGEDRYVLFTVAGAQYAVEETFVTELDRVPKITTVPNVPGWVRGVTNRRGDILSVVEMRGLLGLERGGVPNERMLVVRLLDDSCSLGLLVDDVQQIVSVAASDIRPPAATLEGALAPLLGGLFELNGKAVAVIDLDRLLRSQTVRQFDEPPDAAGG